MGIESVYSTSFSAGKRTYFFDVKETIEQKRYLSIVESKKVDGDLEYDRYRVLIFEEDIEQFQKSFNEALSKFHKNPDQKLSYMQKVKANYENAYQPWTSEDDAVLEDMFCQKIQMQKLIEHFKRNRGAIASRIKKLELKEKYPHLKR